MLPEWHEVEPLVQMEANEWFKLLHDLLRKIRTAFARSKRRAIINDFRKKLDRISVGSPGKADRQNGATGRSRKFRGRYRSGEEMPEEFDRDGRWRGRRSSNKAT